MEVNKIGSGISKFVNKIINGFYYKVNIDRGFNVVVM